ncbi:MAG TPA: N-6 DNA methylase, partial [Halothiobacillus sp.]|nr:N-6 DNA methylase [Halothiobacillus sp.]
MAAPDTIVQLVQKYKDNRTDYKSSNYKEFRLRIEFIDPLFECLGWDMSNSQHYAEAYKDVVHEDSIKIEGASKAPDYAFRIGGTRKFFVETKAPSVDLKNDLMPAYQLRRYGWSAKLPLSILTNFEEFAIYDCRIRPLPNDRPSKARILYINFQDYDTSWAEVEGIFSRPAILKGAFDRYAQDASGKKGTAEVDYAFLAEIESWRSSLATNIALRNKGLNVRQLNTAIQRTIDRIIFLRIAEARGFETYGTLQQLSKGAGVYKRLTDAFRRADARYNSGLFHFKPGDGSAETLDTFTLGLSIDDKILRDIFKNLYYPDCPYEFSVLPADILGQVYEQFLGKVIKLSGRSATVEEKPEVKKAGGVYYTPTYIVRHIVHQTVGNILEGKTPAQASGEDKRVKGAAPVRVLDPACGSGSFLIEIYQYLLDWYQKQYEADGAEKYTKGKQPKLYQIAQSKWRLSIAEKRRILLTHIYGVDIDPQAVEVTKLSLLMKVLEGENGDALAAQMNFFHIRALPDLGRNIKCGNSLIDPRIYGTQQPTLFSDEQYEVINAFDWSEEFPFLKDGTGFDAVIGNPPYLNIDSVWGKGDPRLAAIKAQYPAIYNDKTDIYYYFIAKAVTLASRYVSFICSRAFLESYKGDKLRQFVVDNAQVASVIDFQNYMVFKKAGISTAIITLEKPKPLKGATINAFKFIDQSGPIITPLDPTSTQFTQTSFPHERLTAAPWNFSDADRQGIFDQIDSMGTPLNKVLELGQGMQTGDNAVFGKRTKQDIKNLGIPPRLYRKRASNTDIQRYRVIDREEYLLYLEDEPSFQSLPKKLQAYLRQNKTALSERAACVRKNCEWWKYTWPLHKEDYKKPRILCPYLANSNRFALVETDEFIGLTDTTVLFDSGQPENIRYLLALLNSKIIQTRYLSMAKLKSAGIYEYFWNSISRIPIKRIDFKNLSEKKAHDRLVALTFEFQKAVQR